MGGGGGGYNQWDDWIGDLNQLSDYYAHPSYNSWSDWTDPEAGNEPYQTMLNTPPVFQAFEELSPFAAYQQLMSGGASSSNTAGSLLGGQTSQTGLTEAPTSGWTGSGNASTIPGGALQLLRMRNSPQYSWY